VRDFSNDIRWLSINTATVRKQWPLDRTIEECARRGITAISPWRDQVAAVGLDQIARQLRETGIVLSGYCRGGFFPAATAQGLREALDDNRRAIDEAKTLGAPCTVLVVGSLPGALAGKPEYKDIGLARSQVQDGIGASLEYARQVGMPLAIEPLHPMQAADRACVNTLEQALDICDALDPKASGMLGVAVDAYHVWWDPKLQSQIARAGRERLLAWHVCDWLTPTTDLLSDRGMMGDGVIELRKIRGWIEDLRRSGDLLFSALVATRRRPDAGHLHRTPQALRLRGLACRRQERPAGGACSFGGDAHRPAAPRTPTKIPAVTHARPAITTQDSGSPSSAMAHRADRPGTTAVIMVVRTGPKLSTIFMKPIPEITTDSQPCNTPWVRISRHGASASREETVPVATSSA